MTNAGEALRTSERQLIAVVDDEQDLLELYESILSPYGDVQLFSSPEKFIEKMKLDPQFRPDLIITDYLMPKMTGDKMIEAIHNPENPIASILISGFLDKEKSISAVNAGVTNILEKPVSQKELLRLSNELLLEARSKKIQTEISEVMTMLKEMFQWFRITCLNELDLKTMKDPTLIAADGGPASKAISLEEALLSLENQLERLFKSKEQLTTQLEQLHSRKKGN